MKMLKVLDRCKCNIRDLYTNYSHPATRPAIQFRVLQKFLRDNSQEVSQTTWNFSAHEGIHGFCVEESIANFFNNFASGEITEEMLKESEPAKT